MPFDEHLCCFMLEKYKTRRLTEQKLVDFLSSLKYYKDAWPRAKMYSQLLGFLHTDESYKSLTKTQSD
jgi:hypothetical protein